CTDLQFHPSGFVASAYTCVWTNWISAPRRISSEFHLDHFRRQLHYAGARPLLRRNPANRRGPRAVAPASLSCRRNGTVSLDLRRTSHSRSNMERRHFAPWRVPGYAHKASRHNRGSRKSVVIFSVLDIRCSILVSRISARIPARL